MVRRSYSTIEISYHAPHTHESHWCIAFYEPRQQHVQPSLTPHCVQSSLPFTDCAAPSAPLDAASLPCGTTHFVSSPCVSHLSPVVPPSQLECDYSLAPVALTASHAVPVPSVQPSWWPVHVNLSRVLIACIWHFLPSADAPLQQACALAIHSTHAVISSEMPHHRASSSAPPHDHVIATECLLLTICDTTPFYVLLAFFLQ